MRKTLFISDLHLEESHPEISARFFQFLNNCGKDVDAIYILGDLFETWVGDDNHTLFNLSIIQALREVTDRGIKIYFLHGNRDFLLGKRFSRETGSSALKEEHKILLYGTPILLMHGDTLCTDDVAYLKARKILRNRFYLKLFMLLVPLKSRQNFANRLRDKSRTYTKTATNQIMDVTQSAVIDVMQKHDVNYLIHGHTHRPAIHQFEIQDATAERIVLGAWHHHGSALVWNSNGEKELVSF